MRLTDESLVVLDTKGRLVEFRHVPPQRDAAPTEAPAAAADWAPLFRAAGLTQASFVPAASEWAPKDFADTRVAWEGPSPENSDVRLRIEAASYRGRISSMYLVGPWARPRAQQPLAQSPTDRIFQLFARILWWTVLVLSMLLARHNLRSNRADRRSAARLVGFSLIVQVVAWMVGGHHRSAAAEEINSFFRVFGNMLLNSGVLWVLYVALEPYGRRFWPDGLLGWTRLFAGHVRDPRIGRDILVGAALAAMLVLVTLAMSMAAYLVGRPPGIPFLGGDIEALAGPGVLAIVWSAQLFGSIQTALIISMLFVGLRLVVRRTWIALAIGVPILTVAVTTNIPHGELLWSYSLGQLVAIALITLAIFRYGLLVAAVGLALENLITAIPFVDRGSGWASQSGDLSIALVIAIACFGFYAARAGQPLLGKLDHER
jgi:hypothetical protein